jgi:succinyl-CoA synthetase alpha subunit
MTNDLAYAAAQAGAGVSTAIAIGGDAVVGSTPAELLALFALDPGTDAVLMYGEAGPDLETAVAAALRAGAFTKPLVALVAGDFLLDHAAGSSFGHAGAFIGQSETLASTKRAVLAAAGAVVVRTTGEIPAALSQLLGLPGRPD